MAQVDTEAAPKLVRGLGLTDATMIVMGSMIGSGIFITSADSARLVGAPGWLLVAWLVTGLMTITGSLCCAEIAAMMPHAGGQYVFLRTAYSPMVGFLFGWAMFLVVQTGTIAAVSVAFAKFLGVFVPAIAADNYLFAPVALGNYAVSLSTQQLVAIVLIAVLTATNTQGLKLGTLIQNAFTFTKTAALFGLVVVGLTIGMNRESAAWTSSWWDPSANGWTPEKALPGLGWTGGLALAFLLGKAMIGPLFSQSAWNNVTFTGGETRDPGKTLPRALLFGCGSVVLLYVLANVAYVVSLPLTEIQNAPQDRVGTALMNAVLGKSGTYLMAGAILISTFGCVNGLCLAGAGVLRDGARRPFLCPGRHDEREERARVRSRDARDLVGAPCFSSHGLDRQSDELAEIWQSLQSTSRIPDPSRRVVLRADGRRGGDSPTQKARARPPLSNLRLPAARLDLPDPGGFAVSRFPLPLALGFWGGCRDRSGGNTGLFRVVADRGVAVRLIRIR